MTNQVKCLVVLFSVLCGTIISAQQTFKSVKIGRQVWMCENLTIDKFRNGDVIPEAKSEADWVEAGKEHKPAWCYYNNSAANGAKYGKLYNWYAVTDSRGLAPKGWHVPMYAELDTIIHSLGGQRVAGNKMKSATGWENSGNGNNSSGFLALPAGIRYSEGNFSNINKYGDFWTCTESHDDAGWYLDLYFDYEGVMCYNGMKGSGFSVRCIKDN